MSGLEPGRVWVQKRAETGLTRGPFRSLLEVRTCAAGAASWMLARDAPVSRCRTREPAALPTALLRASTSIATFHDGDRGVKAPLSRERWPKRTFEWH